MVEMLTRPPPCLRLFQQPPSDFGDWKQAEFVIGDAPHCPTVIPRLPPAVGKLRTVLYQPFTATFLIQPVSETSRYRYTCYIGLYQVRREPALAFADGNSRHSAILFVSEDMNSIGYSDSWAFPEKSEYSQLQHILKLDHSIFQEYRIRISKVIKKYDVWSVQFLSRKTSFIMFKKIDFFF